MSDIVCTSPIDGHEVARRSPATSGEIEAAMTSARAAQREWARAPLAERKAAVMRFHDAMLAMKDEIVPELAVQMGRPVRYGGEFGPFTERVNYLVEIVDDALAPITPPPASGTAAKSRREIHRRPAGLVFVIAPWNYPYITAVNTVAPAILAGNAVILKHASQTILVGDRFQMAADAAGWPDGLFQHLVLDHPATEGILSAGLVDHVNFTGSVSGGRAISRYCAGTFTTMGLELGGKDPAYVRADANLDSAIENLVDGAFYNSGQCCCGIERIYVHDSLYDRFVDGFVGMTRQYRLDDPRDPATTLGPMAATRFADLVRRQTAEALARGATGHLREDAFPASRDGTAYLAPQVLTGVDHTMAVMRDESFGPVVGIMKVDDDDAAIDLMNDSDFGLTASIWTEDMDVAGRIGDRVETGTVFMNRCDYVDPGLAWTGVKDTGRGASLSVLGFDALTRPKNLHLRP